jgi:hypothetical protein
MLRLTGSRTLRRAVGAAAAVLVAGCSQFSIPFLHRAPPDLQPSRASAENMISLDAASRSGCAEVRNIEKPAADTAAPAGDGSGTQRWVAHTCTGDISYDVVTTLGPDGPVVRVLPVAGKLNNPMNPNFKPAMPDQ